MAIPEERIVETRPVIETRSIETRRGGGSNGFLYFAVGALIVGVGVLGYMYYNGQLTQDAQDTTIERSADAIGDAADRIGDSVGDLTRVPPTTATPSPAPAPTPAPDPVEPPAPPT